MKLSQLLIGDDKLRKGSRVDKARAEAGVTESLDWRRVRDLPRRALDLTKVEDLTPAFEASDCSGCPLCARGPAALRSIQSAMLWEAEAGGGLLAAVGVGWGKELTCLLLPEALGAQRAVILTKPRLKSQMLEVDLPRYARHFRIDTRRFRVVSYSELSATSGTRLLEDYAPDLIIANECHALRHREAARTRRFLRYMREHRECRFCALSGTLANGSPADYQHLAELALRGGAPLPLMWREAEDWSRALSAGGDFGVGALMDLMGRTRGDEVYSEEFLKAQSDLGVKPFDLLVEDAKRSAGRRIYQERLLATPGVVASAESSASCALEISVRSVLLPPVVEAELAKLRATWKIGDEELTDAKDVARCARQLACGFYYRWKWPDGKKDRDWLEPRAEWHRAVRHILRYSAREGMDSPLLVSRAAERGELSPEHLAAWAAWAHIRGKYKPHPPVEAVWLSAYLVDDVWLWTRDCAQARPGLVWYEHAEFGKALAARGIPVFGAGAEGDAILSFNGPVCAASIEAHRDGKNLQRFCRNLIVSWPANGTACEQLIGRTHRPGQLADEVEVEAYQHDVCLVEAVRKSLEDARFVEEAHGARQKLLLATWVGFKH